MKVLTESFFENFELLFSIAQMVSAISEGPLCVTAELTEMVQVCRRLAATKFKSVLD